MLKSFWERTKHGRGNLVPFLFAGIMFLSAAHHVFNFWELSAAKSLFLFLIVVPMLAVGIHQLLKMFRLHLSQFSKKQFIVFGVGALLISAFLTWRAYRPPASYQMITITPSLSQNQTLSLLELKVNGAVIPLRQTALQNHWQERDGILYAGQNSQPITVSFKSPVNTPVSLLFTTSQRSGAVSISYGRETIQSDLHGRDNGNSMVQFASRYRGISNSIFLPALIVFDIISFGVLILFLLILQELGQTWTRGSDAPARADAWRRPALSALLLLGFVLHLMNFFATPLLLSSDSLSFLQGAAHLLKYKNLDGVSMVVGPASTFLFAPVLLLFGRNPAGMKIMLHLLALACIPVGYRLGWQISRNRGVAFLSGLAAVLSPDLYFYANYVMTDVPNMLLVLLFCTFLLSAIESMQARWIFATLLTSSFAILLRSENVLLLLIGTFTLFAESTWRWLQNRSLDLRKSFLHLSLALLLAILPVIWWSAHNKRIYGFFGMSNYFGIVLYDGWVYYGDASHLAFSNPDSPAIQKVKQLTARYPITITDKSGVATGWETYPALIQAGYTTEQAISLLNSAAVDSIRHNKDLALQLLFLKLKTGLRPEITHKITYALPDEPTWSNSTVIQYFDAENISIPPLIHLQRNVNDWMSLWYPHLYPLWVLTCVLALTLSLFRRPMFSWMGLVATVATRIFVPLALSVPFWRYTLSGWLPLQIITFSWLLILVRGAKSWFGQSPSVSSILSLEARSNSSAL